MVRNTTFLASSCLMFAWCAWDTPAQEPAKVADAVLVCKVTTLARVPLASELQFTSDSKRLVVLSHFSSRGMPGVQPGQPGQGKGKKKGAFAAPGTRSEPVVSVHDVTTGKELFPPLTDFNGKDEPATSATVVVSSNDKKLMTTSGGRVLFWDIETGKPVGATLEHNDTVVSAALSKDGKRLLTSTGPTFNFRGPAKGGVIQPGKKGAAIQPGAKKGMGVKSRVETRLWDVETGKPIGDPITPGARCQVLWSPDGKSIVTASSVLLKGVQFWDPTNMQPVGDPMPARCETAHFSPDGKTLLAISSPGSFHEITLWDVPNRKAISKTLSTVVRDDIPSSQYRSYVVQADGRNVLMCDGAQIQLWDMNAETPVKKRTFDHSQPVYWLAISGDGKYAASAAGTFGRLGEVMVWNLATGRAVCRVPHEGLIFAMEFTPDGRSLATVNDRDVRLWRVEGK